MARRGQSPLAVFEQPRRRFARPGFAPRRRSIERTIRSWGAGVGYPVSACLGRPKSRGPTFDLPRPTFFAGEENRGRRRARLDPSHVGRSGKARILGRPEKSQPNPRPLRPSDPARRRPRFAAASWRVLQALTPKPGDRSRRRQRFPSPSVCYIRSNARRAPTRARRRETRLCRHDRRRGRGLP